jgi:hypothetical protein
LQKRIAEHEAKLKDYEEDPDAYDNKGFLKNAPNEDVRESIIQKRIEHLQDEINNFKNQISQLINRLKGPK